MFEAHFGLGDVSKSERLKSRFTPGVDSKDPRIRSHRHVNDGAEIDSGYLIGRVPNL